MASLFFSFFILFLLYKVFSALGNSIESQSSFSSGHATNSAFRTALLHVLAAEMLADGRVSRSELDVVKRVLITQFDEEEAKDALLELRDILKHGTDTITAASMLGASIDYNSKITIVRILCDIAAADGIITDSEVATIRAIAYNLGVRNYDTLQIISRLNINGQYTYSHDNSSSSSYSSSSSTASALSAAYTTLGISSSATNAEVKEAYRSLVKKYHPDRYATKSPAEQQAAEKKFKEIQTAYDTIKTSRGL